MYSRIGIIQHPPALLDLKESLDRAESHIRDAAQGGASLIVFPETWLTGYPAWAFGMAGWGDPEARTWHARLLAESPIIGHPNDVEDGIAPLRSIARELSVTVVMGLNERSRNGGTLYNSTVVIGPTGNVLNLHRKLMPTHTERIIWGMGDAAGLTAVDTPAGRVGSLICWEHWMPLARAALHATGEQIHISAWPDITEAHEIAARSYAFEGRCFVLSAGLYLEASDIPAALLDAYRVGVGVEAETGDVLFDGGSGVIDPLGNWVVEPVRGSAKTIFADLDLAMVDAGHQDLDVTGHYSRNDIFQLRVDTGRKSGIEFY